jgi:hypothetical protein
MPGVNELVYLLAGVGMFVVFVLVLVHAIDRDDERDGSDKEGSKRRSQG